MKKDTSIFLSRMALLVFLIILAAIDIFCVPIVKLFYGPDRLRFEVLFIITIYALSIPAYFALFYMNKLLRNLSGDEIFTRANTNCLRYTCWCLTAGALILLLGSLNYAGLLCLAAASGFMALIVHIVKNVFEKALLMKDELDLTV